MFVWSTIICSQLCSNENQVYIKTCSEAGILHGNLDPVIFHPFRANAAMDEVNRRADSRQLYWVYLVFKKVNRLVPWVI